MFRLDRRTLRMLPLAARTNKRQIARVAVDPDTAPPALSASADAQVARAAAAIRAARRDDHPVLLTHGAHLIKNGLGPVVIRLLEAGWLTHVATNGAGSIHDWEFAFLGESSEDVRGNVARGQFGAWEETGRAINLAVAVNGVAGLGYGWSVGKLIADERLDIPTLDELRALLAAQAALPAPGEKLAALADLLQLCQDCGVPAGTLALPHPHRHYSVQYAAWRLQIPFTVHPGIGYDIIYTHPLNSGGAIGRGAVRDFLAYAGSVSQLRGGVHLSVGSAIMGPMIFEKSLSMANNLALQHGEALADYTLIVNDIQDGGDWDWRQGEPPMDHPAYYLRFCKSYYRMGGALDYLCLDNRAFLHNLWAALR